MSNTDGPYHRYDRSARDMWLRNTLDVVEGLLRRPTPGGVRVIDPHLVQAAFEVDGLAVDAAGTPIHVEFQTRADPDMGRRMAVYFAALDHQVGQPPEQHLVLLHPDAYRPGLGTHRRGRLALDYEVHCLWELEPDDLLARTGLLRLVPLAKAASAEDRAALLVRAVEAIQARLVGDDATDTLYWAAQLANLYLSPAVISKTLEEDFHMPIDLSHTEYARSFRAEGRAEGRVDARREAVRRFVVGRFGDAKLAEAASQVPEHLLEEAIDVTATATSATAITTWLHTQRS